MTKENYEIAKFIDLFVCTRILTEAQVGRTKIESKVTISPSKNGLLA
jgi:hypothetical protein